MKEKTEHNSIYEPSYGYTGANIKFNMNEKMNHPILSYQFKNGKWGKKMIDYKIYLALYFLS